MLKSILPGESEVINNMSIYHAGMVTAGMIMVYFALSDLISSLSYMIFINHQLADFGMPGNSQTLAYRNASILTAIFKNILAFVVLFGAKGWAKIFYNLRELGLNEQAKKE